MSCKSYGWALRQVPKSSSEKFVLLILADSAGVSGLTDISVPGICAVTQLSPEQAREALASLEAQALISDTGYRGKHKTIYQLPEAACDELELTPAELFDGHPELGIFKANGVQP